MKMESVELNGEKIPFATAVILMDDDIREVVHRTCSPCPPQEFLDFYVKLHKIRFGEDFKIN